MPHSPDDQQEAYDAVKQGAHAYFAALRGRVRPFVDRHFSFIGTLSLHRAALGWDIVRAPVNLSLAVPQVAMHMAAWVADKRAPKLAARLRRPIVLHTDVARELDWLIQTELLILPCRQTGRESRRDALAEAILATPAPIARVEQALGAISRHGDDPAFRERLAQALAEYGMTRAAASEITTGLLSLTGGALTLHKLTPGAATLGPVLAGALAQQAAIGGFPLGSALGGLWYGMFPATPALGLVAATTGGLMLAATFFAAFAGIAADPIQRAVGLHERRLMRLADALERQWLDAGAHGYSVHDHYAARLLDVFDMLGALHRLGV